MAHVGPLATIGGMDEQIRVEFESEIDAEERVELTAEWVAWLEDQPVPSCVDGVDGSLRHGSGDTALA
ncbi:hypothetical protein GCM10010171_39720 [Actinokineospora fastidiosa]|uniref:Uncharacterized protein n=2 Tax=Pseudonocardiaceae TaxID=2070 RepID=A0A918GJ27_9PSEU|nr:hypothetical protein GCM10010171_39720 [Actinokineospora fastidiosa]